MEELKNDFGFQALPPDELNRKLCDFGEMTEALSALVIGVRDGGC